MICELLLSIWAGGRGQQEAISLLINMVCQHERFWLTHPPDDTQFLAWLRWPQGLCSFIQPEEAQEAMEGGKPRWGRVTAAAHLSPIPGHRPGLVGWEAWAARPSLSPSQSLFRGQDRFSHLLPVSQRPLSRLRDREMVRN
jgi:hypothetical protein